MAKVTDKCDGTKPVVICDFSPPRGSDPALLSGAQSVSPDFISVAYSPGKAVRVDPVVAAHAIKQQTGRDAIFTLATRDMNRLATQNHLLGAALLGLENVIVVGGDVFTERDMAVVKDVRDFRPTELVASIKSLNEGVDYRGLKLRAPTDFCVGATIDLGRGIEREARLTHAKISAGADFLITQPIYDVSQVERLRDAYQAAAGGPLPAPVFWGLQVLDAKGLVFGDVPPRIVEELEGGREGVDIAAGLLEDFLAAGMTNIYLVPPIFRGGLRDYEAAQRVIDALEGR